MTKTWLDEEVNFYDFIWQKGTSLCGKHVNKELAEDFMAGGSKFEEMKKLIVKKFPTREKALEEFKQK